MSESRVVSGNDLAAFIGCRPSYITALKKAGRLVPGPDGKGYLLTESLALYAETKDPSRAGVAARHAAARASSPVPEAAAAEGAQAPAGAATEAEEDRAAKADDGHAKRRAKALADKEEALAAAAIRENLVAEGKLMDAGDVAATAASVGNTLRKALERLSDQLAPQLAPMTDEGAIRVMLDDYVEEALREAARQFRALARDGAHA